MITKHDIEGRPERPTIGLVNWMRIPEILRPLRQWVVWTYEWRVKDSGGGCWFKRPLFFDPSFPVGYRYRAASSTNPATWMPFKWAKQIVDYWEVCDPGRVGLEFILTRDDPAVMLDWDDCRDRDTGAVLPAVADLLRDLDSYTEISPSGTGLKTLLLGKKPGTCCQHKGGEPHVEIYEYARPVALTGDTLQWLPQEPQPRQEQLCTLYDLCFPPKPVAQVLAQAPQGLSTAPVGHNLSDADLITLACSASNGHRFDALWRGDWSGYGSQSQADMALASRLAFWCGPDVGRIVSLMWQSGLVRDKWRRRPNYVTDTVEKALAGRTEFYGSRPFAPPSLREAITPAQVEAALAPIQQAADTALANMDLGPLARPDWNLSILDEALAPAQTPQGLPEALPAPEGLDPDRPLLQDFATEADLSRAIGQSYYDQGTYFCEHCTTHTLVHIATGNPKLVDKRCGKCPVCIRRRIDAILARVRYQLADLDARGAPYYEYLCPGEAWATLHKRMSRAADCSLREAQNDPLRAPAASGCEFNYHRFATPNAEHYVVSTVRLDDRVPATAEHVLHELEALLVEHFHGPRLFYSSRAWEEKNLDDDREKCCAYQFPAPPIPAPTVVQIAAVVGATVEHTVPRDQTGDTQGVRTFRKAGGWDIESTAYFLAMIRAGELLPPSCALDFDPDDHSRGRNCQRVHSTGTKAVPGKKDST